MSIICFIPARYGSSRLPGKPLLIIDGKTVIQRTYEQVKKSKLINDIYVLTDDTRISDIIEALGGKSILVTEQCENGTERICYALKKLEEKSLPEIVVNVQGDEPFINPKHIDICIERYKNLSLTELNDVKCTTLHYKIKREDELKSVTCGKLVLDSDSNILYCSRNIIPWNKKNKPNENMTYYGHIGMFCFEPLYLREKYMTGNTPLQKEEDIEWLKILEHGYRIKSVLIEEDTEIGVNTETDYAYLRDKYENRST